MSNNKQSSVEWLSNQTYELFEQYSEGNFDRITLNKLVLEATNKAKEMHKEEIINAINTVSENNVKYANMIVSSWSKIEGELFMHNTKLAEQYYQETYGGDK
jgi:hypothetical protein